jgi:hypothetical protein
MWRVHKYWCFGKISPWVQTTYPETSVSSTNYTAQRNRRENPQTSSYIITYTYIHCITHRTWICTTGTRTLWHTLYMLRLASVVNRYEIQALELRPQNWPVSKFSTVLQKAKINNRHPHRLTLLILNHITSPPSALNTEELSNVGGSRATWLVNYRCLVTVHSYTQ